MPTVRLPNNWRPRDYQMKAWTALEQGYRYLDLTWHRRAGKDEIGLHWTACAAFRRPGTYWHLLPEANQARKAIWEAVNPHTSKRRINEAFPLELRETTREQEMLIRFKNGSTWQLVGSDNYDSLVGSPPIGVLFSEWALAKPEAWSYIRPILAENKGWAIFAWTPRGRNHAVLAFESREQDPEWFTQRLPATETTVFTAADLERERAAYIAEAGSLEEGDAVYRQEYLVDFNAAAPGAYFTEGLNKAQDEGRIGAFPYDPALPVHTAWDIGVDDYTAIWFVQENGRNVRFIDYYETSGDGAPIIVEQAFSKVWGEASKARGRHYLPHDVMVREWGAGAKSRLETLRSLGIRDIRIGQQRDPAERINAFRQLLPIVSFDQRACAVGIERLRAYRKRWNRSLNIYTGPLHDDASHASDAAGEFAVNCQIKPAIAPKPNPNPQDRYRPPPAGKSWKVA